MVGYGRFADNAGSDRLIRWLWFLAAYLAVLVVVASLAHLIVSPAVPDVGWAE